MLWILCYGNQTYGGNPTTSNGINAFAKFAKAAALNYKSASPPSRYEVWNEPENWYLPASTFVALSTAAANAIHSVDPNILVVTGGTVQQTYYSAALSQSNPAYTAVGLHDYTTAIPESISQNLAKYSTYGKTPVWDTESGYSTVGYFSSTIYGGGHSDSARNRQAILDTRRVLSEWALGVPVITLYDLVDDGNDPTAQVQNYGMLDSNLVPKPVYYAIKNLTGAAGSTGQARLLTGLPADLHAIAMRTDSSGSPFASGSCVVVWDEVEGSSHTITFSGHQLVKATNLYGATVAPAGATSVPVSEVGGPIYLYF